MTEEMKNLFYEKLDLEHLNPTTQQYFLKVMSDYIKHGRTYEYIEEKLDRLLFFFECIDIGTTECTIILMNFPGILNIVEELYPKYLFLGILENEDNTFRYHKFFSKTKDYRVGLHKIYARYVLCQIADYPEIRWNTLVHATDSEFAKIFVMGKYKKPYQIFESVEQVLEALECVNFDTLYIDDYKELPVNKELVEKYENKARRY